MDILERILQKCWDKLWNLNWEEKLWNWLINTPAKIKKIAVNHFLIRDVYIKSQSFSRRGNFVFARHDSDMTRIAFLFHYRPTNTYYRVYIKEHGRLVPYAYICRQSEVKQRIIEMKKRVTSADGVIVLSENDIADAKYYPICLMIDPPTVNFTRIFLWLFGIFAYSALQIFYEEVASLWLNWLNWLK